MNYHIKTWIWEQPDWPNFYWDEALIQPLLRKTHVQQGVLLGKMGVMESAFNRETWLDTLLQNIMTSSAIEGEVLDRQSVRSSLAKRLGLVASQPYLPSLRSEGLADMMLDAMNALNTPLSLTRLFQWHTWLFPVQEKTLYPIQVGQLRGEEPMQVVSGRLDNPHIHFEAPNRSILDHELSQFIDWFNQSRNAPTFDPILRAAISHLWFITIHPFDDGNGRITRALTDLALAQADNQSIRLFTLSASILDKRKSYYEILEKSQRGSMDITLWIIWFIETLDEAIQSALNKIERLLEKTRFWQTHQSSTLNQAQIKVLNRLLDDDSFNFGINAEKYQRIAKVSKATATRHLTDLSEQGLLEKLPGGGRNTRYQLRKFSNKP
jgi:Fic family protein